MKEIGTLKVPCSQRGWCLCLPAQSYLCAGTNGPLDPWDLLQHEPPHSAPTRTPCLGQTWSRRRTQSHKPSGRIPNAFPQGCVPGLMGF